MTFKVLKNPSRDLPRGAVVKNPLGNAEDMGLVPALGGFHMPRGNEACGPQLLSPCPRARALQQEKPQQWEAHALQLEKAWTVTKTQSISFRVTVNLFRETPSGSVAKNSPANSRDTGDSSSIPKLGRSPGGGHGDPLQYSYSLQRESHGQRIEPGRLRFIGSQRVRHKATEVT